MFQEAYDSEFMTLFSLLGAGRKQVPGTSPHTKKKTKLKSKVMVIAFNNKTQHTLALYFKS
jgi:hypothetical protein